jgi:hypothetical protein
MSDLIAVLGGVAFLTLLAAAWAGCFGKSARNGEEPGPDSLEYWKRRGNWREHE